VADWVHVAQDGRGDGREIGNLRKLTSLRGMIIHQVKASLRKDGAWEKDYYLSNGKKYLDCDP